LEIEKRQNRQKAAALDAQSAYAQAATMQARSGDTVAELNREIKTPTQDMRGDIKQLLLQQYQTNLLLSDMLNQMAVQTRLHATEKIVDSSVIDPRGCGGRADSDPQTGGKAC
jgi:tryptophan 2,3-dioxygenase